MMKFLHIEEAKYLDGYKVWVKFSDGKEGEIDLQNELEGRVFEPLKNMDYFQRFSLVGHTLSWPNGADFAPEFLYETMKQIRTA
jgi:hypothetical protein